MLPYYSAVHQLVKKIKESGDFISTVHLLTKDSVKCVCGGNDRKSYDLICIGLTTPSGFLEAIRIAHRHGISLSSVRRRKRHLVCAGGWGVHNPEPFSAFVDIVITADAETVLPELCCLVSSAKVIGCHPLELVSSGRGGLYMPTNYDFNFSKDGRIVRIRRLVEYVAPDHPIPPSRLSSVIFSENTAVITAARGCPYCCAFCQIGTEPYVETPIDELQINIAEAFAAGVQRLVINAATLSRHRQFREILSLLNDAQRDDQKFEIVLGSMRADELTRFALRDIGRLTMMRSTIQHYNWNGGSPSLTFAPEVGDDRTRKTLGKYMTNETLFRSVSAACDVGIRDFTFYFIVGFDFCHSVESITNLVTLVIRRVPSIARLTLRLTPFIATPRTLMQRFGMAGVDRTWREIDTITEALMSVSSTTTVEVSVAMTPSRYLIEALLMRGDRRLGPVLCELSTVEDDLIPSVIDNILADHGMHLWQFLGRRDPDELLPWAEIDNISLDRQRFLMLELPCIQTSVARFT